MKVCILVRRQYDTSRRWPVAVPDELIGIYPEEFQEWAKKRAEEMGNEMREKNEPESPNYPPDAFFYFTTYMYEVEAPKL